MNTNDIGVDPESEMDEEVYERLRKVSLSFYPKEQVDPIDPVPPSTQSLRDSRVILRKHIVADPYDSQNIPEGK